MKLAAYLLFLQALFLLYYSKESNIYLAFGVLNFLLAWGLIRGNKGVMKITLIYKGLDLFFSVLMLMAGSLSSGISALIDFIIIHDLVGLFGQREDGRGEVKEE